jgi:REP element-mobilizing transposase RayT
MIKGRPPRLGSVFQNYDRPLYFVTICTLHRQPFEALKAITDALNDYGNAAIERNIALGRYVVMPDHVHLFVRGGPEFRLGDWVKGLKRFVSRRCPSAGWQPGFFDHLLRNTESYGEKWNYVRDNPVRAGLAKAAEDWPYAGEIIVIDRA